MAYVAPLISQSRFESYEVSVEKAQKKSFDSHGITICRKSEVNNKQLSQDISGLMNSHTVNHSSYIVDMESQDMAFQMLNYAISSELVG